MKVLICGIDGYLGWSLAQHLTHNGFVVGGCDNFNRRKWVKNFGSCSAIPIDSLYTRLKIFEEIYGEKLRFYDINLTAFSSVYKMIKDFNPDAIVHLAEMPSAPFSMESIKNAVLTHRNNIEGTLNLIFSIRDIKKNIHLVKLGTMGEYGTPNVDIPEGFFELDFRGRKDYLMFPRKAGSWYHQTKVHDTNNIEMACRLWGLSSTDIMQGVVYGTRLKYLEDKWIPTRFDFDGVFGTVINRFCAQVSIGFPITPYGLGKQKRGFLPLCDSMKCLTLAIENPPSVGEYRTFNQFEEVYTIRDLADKVKSVGDKKDLDCVVKHINNPRLEDEEHYYNPDNKKLFDLGYTPSNDMDDQLNMMFDDLVIHKDRIKKYSNILIPDIRWDGSKNKSGFIGKV